MTLLDKTKAIFTESELSKDLWNEAIFTATYLTNRSPTSKVKGMTPYEKWYITKPNIGKFL